MNGIFIWEAEGGRTTGTCVWTPASGVLRVYQCVNTELTVRQPKTGRKKKVGRGIESKETEQNIDFKM